MGPGLSKLDEELLDFVGEADFAILKNLKQEDKEMIAKSIPAIRIADSMKQLFWLGDKNHYTIYINPTYRELTGYSLAEVLKNRSKSDFCFTEESKATIAKHHELRAKGLSSQYEADIVTKKGNIIPVLIHGTPTEKGGTIGIFSNLLTIDKLNREERQLLEIVGYDDFKIIKKMLKKEDVDAIMKVAPTVRIANAMGQCFWIGDNNHKTIYANKVYRELTEYTLEECIGKDSDFCFDEESKQMIAQHHTLRRKGVSSQYEATYQTKSGKKVPMLIIGAPHEFGGTYGMHINMTEIKELALNKQITDQIIRNSIEAIVILDKNQHIKLWNQGASKVFGYEESEVLNKSIEIIVPQDKKQESDELITQAYDKKILKNYETQRITKDKKLVDVSISVSKVTDQKNKFIGYLVIYRDVSEQKKTNVELQKRFETIQDAYKELGLQKRQIDYLYEISNAATSDAPLQSLANLIVSAICLLTKCDGTTLRLYDQKKNILKLIACMGVSQKWLSKSQITYKGSLAEDAVKAGRPLLMDNIQSSSKHKGVKLLKAHNFSTLILIPLLLPNKVIGTISLYSTDPVKFRFIETDFLENFGKQCAIGLYVKSLPGTRK
jgi:PAS domain S-box-containing protein